MHRLSSTPPLPFVPQASRLEMLRDRQFAIGDKLPEALAANGRNFNTSQITIARTLGEVGVYFSPIPTYFDPDNPKDEQLDIGPEAFALASQNAIEGGLYRAKRPNPLITPTIALTYFAQNIGQNTSVYLALPPEEDKVIPSSPADYIKGVLDIATSAHEWEAGEEWVDELITRSGIHAADGKLIDIGELYDAHRDTRIKLAKLYRAARFNLHHPGLSHGETKDTASVAELLQFADEKIHQTAEISAKARGLNASERTDMHKAIVSNLYRQGRQQDRLRHLMNYIVITGLYIDARALLIQQQARRLDAVKNLLQQRLQTSS